MYASFVCHSCCKDVTTDATNENDVIQAFHQMICWMTYHKNWDVDDSDEVKTKQMNGQNARNFFASLQLHNNSALTSSDVDTPLEYFYIVELQQWWWALK